MQTVIFNDKNPTISASNPTIQNKKLDLDIEKLKEETIIAMIEKQKYFAKTKKNLLDVYASVITNQVFGAPEVKKILGCTDTVSKDIMKKFRNMGIVIEVKGKGKGKYRFIYEDEIHD